MERNQRLNYSSDRPAEWKTIRSERLQTHGLKLIAGVACKIRSIRLICLWQWLKAVFEKPPGKIKVKRMASVCKGTRRKAMITFDAKEEAEVSRRGGFNVISLNLAVIYHSQST